MTTRIQDLPEKQQEIAVLTMKGYNPKEIADMRDCAQQTVHQLKLEMRKKLGIENDMQLFAIALRDRIKNAKGYASALASIEGLIDEVLP